MLQSKASSTRCPALCGPGGEPECTDPRCSGMRCERWRAQDEKRAYESPAAPEPEPVAAPAPIVTKAAPEPASDVLDESRIATIADVMVAIEQVGEALGVRDEQITRLRSQLQVFKEAVAELETKAASAERRLSRQGEHLANQETKIKRIDSRTT